MTSKVLKNAITVTLEVNSFLPKTITVKSTVADVRASDAKHTIPEKMQTLLAWIDKVEAEVPGTRFHAQPSQIVSASHLMRSKHELPPLRKTRALPSWMNLFSLQPSKRPTLHANDGTCDSTNSTKTDNPCTILAINPIALYRVQGLVFSTTMTFIHETGTAVTLLHKDVRNQTKPTTVEQNSWNEQQLISVDSSPLVVRGFAVVSVHRADSPIPAKLWLQMV